MKPLRTAPTPSGLEDAPADLRDFVEALASEGVVASLPTVGAHDALPEPLVARTSLSAAIIEDRAE